ncbi:MAG TPA: hypothetical protein PKK66_07240 [Bacteroidales bacterium]|nr:hypothetical protein [Bacteroidales bacterium]MDD4394611.1 hypothetical protein [Bacteroidales bacterium]HNW68625.1 hypothetical protein [Bacteroidales bacterium]HPT53195.1 hypothetical protein [Bacteroidales bacterium]
MPLILITFYHHELMEEKDFNVGTRIDHEKYGEGIISQNNQLTYKAIFIRGGEIEFSKMSAQFQVVEVNERPENNDQPRLNLREVEHLITTIFNRYNAIENKVELGKKWEGGMLIMQPGNPELKPKEIPVETFFHKIVMMRDRLRVLEQNINSHTGLSDEDKINLQQYITRIYGSMTSFNILFDDKNDFFIGSKA